MTRPPRDQLRQAIDARRKELRLTCLDVDSDAGLPSGYFSKYLCGSRNLGTGSLDRVLKALGVRILLVPTDSTGGMQASSPHFPKAKITKIASFGGKVRWQNVPPEERSALGRKLAQARWDKRRRSAALCSARTRRKNQAALVVWERLILCGAIEPTAMTHGFFTGPGMAWLAGSMFKRKGRKRHPHVTTSGNG
jgi:hypothetical protein